MNVCDTLCSRIVCTGEKRVDNSHTRPDVQPILQLFTTYALSSDDSSKLATFLWKNGHRDGMNLSGS